MNGYLYIINIVQNYHHPLRLHAHLFLWVRAIYADDLQQRTLTAGTLELEIGKQLDSAALRPKSSNK